LVFVFFVFVLFGVVWVGGGVVVVWVLLVVVGVVGGGGVVGAKEGLEAPESWERHVH
jgi:hypothetical protein